MIKQQEVNISVIIDKARVRNGNNRASLRTLKNMTITDDPAVQMEAAYQMGRLATVVDLTAMVDKLINDHSGMPKPPKDDSSPEDKVAYLDRILLNSPYIKFI